MIRMSGLAKVYTVPSRYPSAKTCRLDRESSRIKTETGKSCTVEQIWTYF
jgi:hypothetical protein